MPITFGKAHHDDDNDHAIACRDMKKLEILPGIIKCSCSSKTTLNKPQYNSTLTNRIVGGVENLRYLSQ